MFIHDGILKTQYSENHERRLYVIKKVPENRPLARSPGTFYLRADFPTHKAYVGKSKTEYRYGNQDDNMRPDEKQTLAH